MWLVWRVKIKILKRRDRRVNAEDAEKFPLWDGFCFSLRTLRYLRVLCGYAFCVHPNELTREIIGAAIKIHRALGPGLLESAYEACLAHELELLGLRVERQKPIPLIYKAVKLDCGFRADLVVEGRIVVETKCKDALHPVDEAQILSHLRLLNLQVGLLINFHVLVLRDGIKRIVNEYRDPVGLAS